MYQRRIGRDPGDVILHFYQRTDDFEHDGLTGAVRQPRSNLDVVSESSRSTPAPVVDIIEDGMTDQEIVAHTQAWLAELRELPISDVGVSAAETLDELYADGEL